MKHDAVYVNHILDAIGRIETYVAGLEREAFFRELMVQDAVVRQLEIIGMRNRIAHDYLNIDLQVVWEVVRQDLPLLKDQIAGLA